MLIRDVNTAKSGIDVTVLADKVKGLHSSSPLFTVFGQEVYAQNLFQHGVVIRILQKRPFASVRVRYLCPSGFAAVFKAPHKTLVDNVFDTLYYATQYKWFYALEQYQASEAKITVSRADLLEAVVAMNDKELENIKISHSKAVVLPFKRVA